MDVLVLTPPPVNVSALFCTSPALGGWANGQENGAKAAAPTLCLQSSTHTGLDSGAGAASPSCPVCFLPRKVYLPPERGKDTYLIRLYKIIIITKKTQFGSLSFFHWFFCNDNKTMPFICGGLSGAS